MSIYCPCKSRYRRVAWACHWQSIVTGLTHPVATGHEYFPHRLVEMKKEQISNIDVTYAKRKKMVHPNAKVFSLSSYIHTFYHRMMMKQ